MKNTVNSKVMRLALPSVLENISTMLVSFADTAMVGVLGPLATAAVAVNASPSWLINGLMVSLGVGGTALVSRYIGAKDEDTARDIAFQLILLGLLLSLAITLLVVLIAPFIPVFMGADPSIHSLASSYMRILAFGFIPHFTGLIISAQLRGAGDTKTPMKAGLMANIINVVLNFLLIYETRKLNILGIEFTMIGFNMGVKGAAIASAVGMASAGFYILYKYLSRKSLIHLPKHFKLKLDMEVINRVLKISIPASFERLSINLGQIVFASFVSRIGTVELAAHHIAITIEALGYMPGYGFSVPATALVGQSLGANKPKDAKKYGLKATSLGVSVMSFMGLIMFVFAEPLISFFIKDEGTRKIGANLLRICALQQPFSGLSIIVPGALRGAGDTFAPFIISLFSMWGVRILFAYIFSSLLGYGIYGIWFAMLLDLFVRGILMLVRFLRGKWQLKRI